MGRRTLLLIASILVAALGTALIWLYVQGADSRAEATTTQVEVVVAAGNYPAGTPAKSIATRRMSYPQTVIAGLGAGVVTDPQRLDGYAQTNVVAGLPLLDSAFGKQIATPAAPVALAPDKIALQVTLPDPQRLAGLLAPGSHIRIYVSEKQPKNDKCSTRTRVLLNDVKVLASGPVPADQQAQTPTQGTTGTTKADVPQAIVTMELDDTESLRIVNSQTQDSGGKNLWFGLLGSKPSTA